MTEAVVTLLVWVSLNAFFVAGIGTGVLYARAVQDPWRKGFTRILVDHMPHDAWPGVLADLERLRREITDGL